MRWLDKLERHLGFIAMPNLILAVIAGQALSTLAALKEPSVPLLLMLDPISVASGQWWRLFTWVIVPSTGAMNLIFAIFWFQFLYTIGQSLEADWGVFRATLYILLGIALPSLGAMLAWQLFGAQVILTGSYFSITLLLAFAALAPEMSLMLMFILPVKMKWVAWALGAYLMYSAFSRGTVGFLEVLFGTGNYLIFFVPLGIQEWKQRKLALAGQKVFKEAAREIAKIPTRTCVDCGRGNEADLRLCTCERCGDEGRNYCAEHLVLHLAVPEKMGTIPAAKKKRKS